ncbi:hypothetical protein JCGZ_19030 [Jatropha curcas]|uniref:Pectinesterase inhibitor domain-containing protein n=1 Tax=Jatropha curcas TaxID=180498 RepID=A0A067K6Q3_JATCU|nr:hypothetical protein JCGZ_19030 [Jatropha curcas]
MKNTSNFLAHHLLVISVTLLGTQFVTVQSDANLIVQTCKNSPNYNLCVNSLRSDSRSTKADSQGLALIMVHVLKNRATETLQVIKQELKRNPRLRKELSSCVENYDVGILSADIPVAIEALEKGDPKFAETAARDAADEASFCEENFNGNSPLTKYNKVVHETGAVAAAIIRPLL